MSSDKVTKFLEEKKTSEIQKKEKELALLKYKILSHYELGELVYYKEGDKIDDFPLSYVRGKEARKCKYDCNISDEDFEKVHEIYNKEVKTSKTSEINNGAENTLVVYASVALAVGIIVFLICFIAAFSIKEWSLIITGLSLLLVTLVVLAFVKVFVNISYKMDKIASLLNKQKKD